MVNKKRRNKMKTKIFGLILALFAIVAVLASCGGDKGDDKPKPGPDGIVGNTEYDWPAGTEIIMQLGMNSSGKELPSGCKDYYSGENMQAQQPVHQSVRKRNNKAEVYAKVDVKYTYVGENDQGYGWGSSFKEIMAEVQTESKLSPDIYVNFAYDITCASIRNCFANLLSTDTADYAKGNHFRFVEDDYNPTVTNYFDANAGEGYFYAYMESLSLTPDSRLYCIGSNYTLDLVRAFYVIPVNVNLMATITDIQAAPAGDQDGDGDHDIKDFYALVQNGEYGWDYEALAGYATLCKSNTNTDNPNADIKDERIGFALGIGSGLSSSGILYTTDVEVLKWDETQGKYVYPATAGKLAALTNALNNLFANNRDSVCTVTAAECSAAGLTSGGEGEMMGIRYKFAQDGVLFGGIICVGALEETVYQNMRKDGSGFGVVPVPIFQDHKEAGDTYLTSIHNIARIATISRSSTEKSQCSAFLDYQSRNSAEILEDYYVNTLTAATGGLAGEYNAQMLTYIRNHVRTCFDKTFEDAIANYILDTDSNAYTYRWHHILMANNYEITNMDSMYLAYYETKQANLDKIYAQWNSLKPAN